MCCYLTCCRLLGVCKLEEFLPQPCLNLFIFVRQRLQGILSPKPQPKSHIHLPSARKLSASPAAVRRPTSVVATTGVGPPAASEKDNAEDTGSSSRSNRLFPAVSLLVLALDALAGCREAAAVTLLLGLGEKTRLGFAGPEGFWGIHTPRKRQQQRTPRSPRRSPAATVAAAATAAAATETAEGRARLLLCGLLHCRLSQGKLKTLQRYLIPLDSGERKGRDRGEKVAARPNASMTLAHVQAVRRRQGDSSSLQWCLFPNIYAVSAHL